MTFNNFSHKMSRTYHFLQRSVIGLILWCSFIGYCTTALSVELKRIQSAADIQHLADLRYNEWIRDQFPDTSQSGFAMATSELYHERAAEGAVGFLAMEKSISRRSKKGSFAMGAGELSPIEIEGTIDQVSKDPTLPWLWYITDVVTAREHRRKGVARALMDAMEVFVANHPPPNQHRGQVENCQTTCLLLHVESINEPALLFYESLGYTPTLPSILDNTLDTERLAVNAGTQDQILLCKQVTSSNNKKSNAKTQRKTSRGRGFG